MSLQLAAKHLAAHGRGKDTELIHMDKGEIASLQKLAQAHGGSLTTNPHTGLPEAGLLSAMLPMVLGAGLAATGVGAPLAALMVGGGYTLANGGDLKKGLMAGLGAYGGAGLASSFGTAGAEATTTLNGAPVTPTPAPVANPAGITSTPASNVIDVSGSSLPTTTPVTGPATGAEAMQAKPLEPMTGGQTDPYANAGFEGSGKPPGYQTTPDVTGKPLSDPMYSDYGGATKGLPTQTYEVTPKSFADMTPTERVSAMGRGASFDNAGTWVGAHPYAAAGAAASVASGMQKDPVKIEPDRDMGQRYSYSAEKTNPLPAPDVPTYEDMLTKQGNFGRQQKYFSPSYTPISASAAKDLYHFAGGGPVEQMSNQAALGANTMYPMADMATSAFSTPYQTPHSTNMLDMSSDVPVGQETGELSMQGTRLAVGGMSIDDSFDPQNAPEGGIGSLLRTMMAGKQQAPNKKYTYNPDEQQYTQQMATGGISDAGYNLGGYSDGGRLLRGPGDGVSDSIPAVIGKKQPARLADGEFVVPARIVSELGNGSTEAGARKLYAMMDRIQASRKNTVGKGKVAKNNRADKYLPA
jgi:hypothetical protein